MSDDPDDETEDGARGRNRDGSSRPRVLARYELKRAVDADRTRPVDPNDYDRPRTRGDCAGGERPCPFVSCRHHLYLSVNPESGAITLSFPDLEPWELAETCALDVADRGGTTLEEVGDLMNLTRERIRQVEVKALETIREDPASESLR